MNKNIIIIALVFVCAFLFFSKNKDTNTQQQTTEIKNLDNQTSSNQVNDNLQVSKTQKIDALTRLEVVAKFVKENGRLPNYYVKKRDAEQNGWNKSKGNLCQVLPNKAIGGDNFGNREGQLPHKNGRRWFEADLNYNCGRRGSDRLLFSNDGLVFYTLDHYKSFQEFQ